MNENKNIKEGIVFPLGLKNDAYAKYFMGQSYLNELVNDSDLNVSVGVVTFEPQCRNNWHIHHNGYQIY